MSHHIITFVFCGFGSDFGTTFMIPPGIYGADQAEEIRPVRPRPRSRKKEQRRRCRDVRYDLYEAEEGWW